MSAPSKLEAQRISLWAGAHKLAGRIDHTLLRPEATRTQIEQLCREALDWGFAAVAVNSAWVACASEQLHSSPVKVATVAGFPLGATSTFAKRAEAEAALLAGAQEIDMVLNLGALRS